MNEASEISQRYQKIKNQIQAAIAASHRTDAPTLIAVSKKQSLDSIRSLYDLGHRDFGENYAQELTEKAGQFEILGVRDIRWHFIGHLQTNKVKQLLPFVASIHSVDSLKLAREISKRWLSLHPKRATALPIFLAVNIDGEESKSGASVSEARALCEEVSVLEGVRLEGLMCIPSPDLPDPSDSFSRLRSLEERCRPFTHGRLSMGMSGDFPSAISQGATHIRVGTSLFGKRGKRWSPPFG